MQVQSLSHCMTLSTEGNIAHPTQIVIFLSVLFTIVDYARMWAVYVERGFTIASAKAEFEKRKAGKSE